MNSKIGLLSALLVFQLVLVAIALTAPLGDSEAPGQLLEFAVDDVDRLTVSDGTSTVEVALEDGLWQVAGVPADADKVADILDKLAAIEAPWPVATSAGSAARFEVSEADYQRHVSVFAAGDTVAELYLGTSPGYQRVHARRADSDEVFSVALSNYEIGVSTDNWVDKAVLAMAAAPTSIELTKPDGSVETLRNGDEGWLYNGAAANQDEAATYANRFTTLRVLGLVDEDAAVGNDGPSERGRIVAANADVQTTLIISRQSEEDDYLVTTPDGAITYRLATYIAEQLLMADSNFSVQDAAAEEVEPQDEAKAE